MARSRTADPDVVLSPRAWAEDPPARPFETLAHLREHDPVARARDPDGHAVRLVTRHADIVTTSHDTATFSSRDGVVTLAELDQEQLDTRRVLMEHDPPRHTAWRRLLQGDFSPRAVRGLETAIRLITRATLDELADRTTFDGVTDLSEQVPITVLCRLMGVPDERSGELVSLGNRMVSLAGRDELDGVDPDVARLLPFGHPAALEAFAMARTLAERRRQRPGDDITSLLVHGEIDGRPLTETEFQMTWLFLVVAGNETTRHAISYGLQLLAVRPDLFAAWAADDTLDTTAAEEVLRLAVPIVWHKRTATTDTEIAGHEVRRGESALLVFPSGNRDDAVFTAPDEVALDRSPNPHVTFGRGGPHFCLGAHLARLEIAVVFRELFARASSLRPAGPATRVASNHFNGLSRLPLAITWR